MDRSRRLGVTVTSRAALGAVIGGALMLVFATIVFACTYIPHLYAISPRVGVPGTDMTLQGNAATTTHPVTLRWNGVNGPVLGTATPDGQGNFQTTVKVPDVAPGTYFVVADSGGRDVARAAFEVTGAGNAAGAPLAPAVAPDATAGSGGAVVYAAPADSSWLGSALIPGLVLFAVGTVAATAFGFVLARRRRVPTRVR